MTRPQSTRLRSADRYVVDDATGCWNWTGKLSPNGYPQHREYRRIYVEVWGGLPEGYDVQHHACRNKACVNPEHLEALPAIRHREQHKLHELAGITLDDVREIRRLGRIPGVRAEDLARRYGVHENSIRNYWREARWGELTGDTERVVADPRPCARPGCLELMTGRRHRLYCSAACRRIANRAKRRMGLAA